MRLIVIGTELGLALTAAPAAAFGPMSGGAFRDATESSVVLAKSKYKWKAGGCKYEYKADRKGFKEKYKCK